jgi:hypothetical protein
MILDHFFNISLLFKQYCKIFSQNYGSYVTICFLVFAHIIDVVLISLLLELDFSPIIEDLYAYCQIFYG